MAEPILPAGKTDTVHVTTRNVACDGPSFSKHPRVYLTMVDDTDGAPHHVVCPYCSRTFIYDPRNGAEDTRH